MTRSTNIPRWCPRWVGIAHTSGPSPLRSAKESDPPFVAPDPQFPFGFKPAPKPVPKKKLRKWVPPPEKEPQLWDGDNS